MEVLQSPSGTGKHASSCEFSPNSFTKDLWFISQQGSVAELDSALVLLNNNGGNIDSRNAFGLTPLHIATWRNHVPIVKRLLAAGADPDARVSQLYPSCCSSICIFLPSWPYMFVLFNLLCFQCINCQ